MRHWIITLSATATTRIPPLLPLSGAQLRPRPIGSRTRTSPAPYLDVDTTSGNFGATPLYFASLGGNAWHWELGGAQAIYSPTPTGFRVYLWHRWRGVSPEFANQQGWHVNWLGGQL